MLNHPVLLALDLNYGMLGAGFGVLFLFFIVAFLASRYRRCPSNKVLCVYGRVGEGQSVQTYHGGGAFVWPLIQDYKYLDLTPMTISIPLKNALSLQNIRINVPSTFTIAIHTEPQSMNQAAIRLLELEQREIEQMATEIIFGQLRLTVASLTIEQINQDRESFLASIRNNVEAELRKVGLYLINVNITDITDESGYIESIGKKAAATAVNQARVDVAEQEKLGAIGEAQAQQEQRIRVAAFTAQAVEGENTAKAKMASYNADLQEQEAEAQRRAKVAQQVAFAEVQKARADAENSRLEAEEVVPREIEKKKVEISASAEAERRRREAQGRADAILALRQAEAEGLQKVLDAKSEGYRKLVESCGGNAQAAATMLMVEKMEELVKLQTEAVKNLKIDKITVWDGGAGGKKGSTTANFVSSMVKSLPALHDVAQMAGVKLPEYLGHLDAGANGHTKAEPAPRKAVRDALAARKPGRQDAEAREDFKLDEDRES
ncbi:MAG: SPFH domain-containing protein [Planctomycetota bacterium]|nr:SPFH domain-containing protein [Planctomycetota bacterium]